MTARECALRVLFEVEQHGAYSDAALKKELRGSGLSAADRAFATELTFGVVRHRTRLDYVISKFSKYSKLSCWISNILRLGVYQLLFLEHIPHSAAVNECVNLAKRYGHKGTVGFVNGVLRAISRSGDVTYPTGKAYDEIYHSHPAWLVNLLVAQYGQQTASQMIAANNQTPPVTVRPNLLRTTVDDLTKALQQTMNVTPTAISPMLALSKTGDIGQSEAFLSGLFTPQDPAAYLAAKAVNPQPGELILDVCAAPGGKTTALAELSGDKATIKAFDIHPHKVALIEKNVLRLGLSSVTAHRADATVLQPQYIGQADCVLADVPCSGLGLLRKKPDIKWRRNETDIVSLIQIQQAILQCTSQYVKPGGRLVYATCTVNKQENEGVTHPFAEQFPFEIVEEQTLLPHEHGCDGFYICTLRRT